MREFLLLGTLGCHLCDDAEALLNTTQSLPPISLEIIDIADDPQLLERYALHIPVLIDLSSKSELAWPFDEQSLQYFVHK